MRRNFLILYAVAAMTIAAAGSASAQAPSTASDRLLDLLLRGIDRVTVSAYDPALRPELENVVRRKKVYRSRRRDPVSPWELKVVYDGRVGYERLLVSMTDDPAAPALAAKYADELRPCYEWEGYHGCPEREAAFATAYLKSHPGSPFSEYLPLLAAHRWLCAAEAYKFEKNPKDAARSRRAYDAALATARESSSALIRAAAEALNARGTCFPREQR
jgi:hypothetical protein